MLLQVQPLVNLWCLSIPVLSAVPSSTLVSDIGKDAADLSDAPIRKALTETPSTDESKYKPMQMAEKEIQKQYSPKEAATSHERKKLGDVDIADQNRNKEMLDNDYKRRFT
ncbi:hypothetical protein PCANC_13485 [Puccinia coronata f. sp. avenae]|uniref:Uncharacterized protein n=1 Tax=Puccinia coronata f. sp. avenae TaxID=200324 RepID=A0A2N5V4Q2_9BASI|nr:hypothetical protein PCANC_13485 [Puccinia coronata f. sp. avenae]